ncbi:MAG: beta-lactamase family protein [Bacteroidales bacterium]|nr:beta-lactamase family protein [Bacteroidales bacterium]
MKGRKISKTGKILIGALGVALLLALYLLLRGCAGGGRKPSEYRIRGINSVITNESGGSVDKLDRDMKTFMQRWWIKGMSLSVMRRDSLLYAKGYGKADEDVPMSPGHIMRVASVSKLITAAGIMKLQEQGRIKLSDKVFGPSGILDEAVYTAAIKDKNYFKITVEDLLRHESGLSIRRGDPMFTTRDIMNIYRLKEAPDHETLVRLMLARQLGYQPGKSRQYSNFGYLLLSMIIEKVTGESYERWMQKELLGPAGCMDMHLAFNYYKDKYPNEVRYYMQDNDPLVPEYNNSRDSVVRCYGGSDVRALAGAGAWVASTPELARFVASVDGNPRVKDVIGIKSVRAMTADTGEHKYGLGWNDVGDTWIRTGSLAGTNAIVYRFPDGECWILVSNTHNWKGPRFSKRVKEFIRQCHERYSPALPKQDLFELI